MNSLNQQRNLIYSLILSKNIKTTKQKAKKILLVVDGLVNKLKKNFISGRREVLKFINEKKTLEKLEKEIIPKLAKRESGYLRFIKIENRRGDNAQMARLEWVWDTEVGAGETESKTAKEEKNVKTNKKK